MCGLERGGSPLRIRCTANPTDRGAWCAAVHGMARGGHDMGTKQQQQEQSIGPSASSEDEAAGGSAIREGFTEEVTLAWTF